MVFSLNRIGAELAGRLGFLDVYSAARRALTRSRVAIIVYHQVSSESPPWLPGAVRPEDFEIEIRYLCKVAEILPLEWLVNRLYLGESIPQRAVCITFDDGYKHNYTTAYPILRKYNAPATIFLTTGCIGGPNIFWWSKVNFAIWNTIATEFEVAGLKHYYLRSSADRRHTAIEINHYLMKLPTKGRDLLLERLLKVLRVELPDNIGEQVTLSWDEVLKMSQNGISFGAHTVTHPILTRLPSEEAREEICNSKKNVEERLGKPCTLFAYPDGDFNAEIVELVRESGFTAAVTGSPKLLNNKRNDLLLLPRISAGPNFYTFKGSFSGLYPDLMTIMSRFRKSRG